MVRSLTHRCVVNVMLMDEQGRVALMERTGTDSFVGDFCGAGGGVELNETIYEAAVRELKEEMGVEAAIPDLEFVTVIERPSRLERVVEFFFICRKWVGEVKNIEPHKHACPAWYSPDALPEKTSPYEKIALRHLGKPGLVVK